MAKFCNIQVFITSGANLCVFDKKLYYVRTVISFALLPHLNTRPSCLASICSFKCLVAYMATELLFLKHVNLYAQHYKLHYDGSPYCYFIISWLFLFSTMYVTRLIESVPFHLLSVGPISLHEHSFPLTHLSSCFLRLDRLLISLLQFAHLNTRPSCLASICSFKSPLRTIALLHTWQLNLISWNAYICMHSIINYIMMGVLTVIPSSVGYFCSRLCM